jgi:20S proteasome alpha/beta subunit
MTVVAYKDGILVADRRYIRGSQMGTMTKIFRWKNHLIGFCGTANKISEWFSWFKNKKDIDTEDLDLDVLVISKIKDELIINLYEGSTHPIKVEDKFCSIGSGSDFAVCAMHLGYSAIEAVDITIQLCPDCGNGFDMLEFD